MDKATQIVSPHSLTQQFTGSCVNYSSVTLKDILLKLYLQIISFIWSSIKKIEGATHGTEVFWNTWHVIWII
jgi:hypothetical protein